MPGVRESASLRPWVWLAAIIFLAGCAPAATPTRIPTLVVPPARQDAALQSTVSSPTAAPYPTYTLFPTHTPNPTYTLSPTHTPLPTYTLSPAPTPVPVPTPTTAALLTPSPNPTARPAPAPTPTLEPISTATPTPPAPSPAATPTPTDNEEECGEGRVDVNTADIQELELIIHIGSARAADMVRLRPFTSLDDLDRISGIGPARLAEIVSQGVACVGN